MNFVVGFVLAVLLFGFVGLLGKGAEILVDRICERKNKTIE